MKTRTKLIIAGAAFIALFSTVASAKCPPLKGTWKGFGEVNDFLSLAPAALYSCTFTTDLDGVLQPGSNCFLYDTFTGAPWGGTPELSTFNAAGSYTVTETLEGTCKVEGNLNIGFANFTIIDAVLNRAGDQFLGVEFIDASGVGFLGSVAKPFSFVRVD